MSANPTHRQPSPPLYFHRYFHTEEFRAAGHINLVHCLSYGEWWLVLEGEKYKLCPKNGTSPWWKFLATLAGFVDKKANGHDPLAGDNTEVWTTVFKDTVFCGGTPGSEKRQQQVRNKVAILEALRQYRIVVLDISPIAIFLASGTKEVLSRNGKMYKTQVHSLSDAKYKAIMNLCWKKYMLPLIKKLKPEQVIILGDKPADAIGRPENVQLENNEKIVFKYLIHPSARTHQQSKYMPFLRKARDWTASARDVTS